MKVLICIFIVLIFNQLFCQIDFYIETDETSYFYGQDIYITFNLHNTTSDTVIVTWGSIPPYDYYIDDEFFLIGSYHMVLHIPIPPDSIHSTPYIHTDNVSIGDHILIGEFNSNWLSDPVSITVEQVSVENHELSLTSYQLSNYPNPFNPTTVISFSVPQSSSFVTIKIYNLRGQKIKTIKIPNPSSHNPNQITWNGTNEIGKQVPSGVYLYKLVSNGKELAVNKMLLLK